MGRIRLRYYYSCNRVYCIISLFLIERIDVNESYEVTSADLTGDTIN